MSFALVSYRQKDVEAKERQKEHNHKRAKSFEDATKGMRLTR